MRAFRSGANLSRPWRGACVPAKRSAVFGSAREGAHGMRAGRERRQAKPLGQLGVDRDRTAGDADQVAKVVVPDLPAQDRLRLGDQGRQRCLIYM